MNKRLWLIAGLVAILSGCGQQPQLDVNEEENTTTPTAVEQNVTVEQEEEKPVESDLTDTTTVKVTEDSIEENNVTTDEEEEETEFNQQLAKDLTLKTIYFDFDKYEIKSSQMGVVEASATLLKNAKGTFTVRIEGNCDEWGRDEYNYALGLKRAKVVKQALIDLGVDENRLTIISYGETNPVCNAHNKSCWSKNRRDNFTLLP